MSGRVQRCRHGRDKMWAKFYCQQRGDRQLGSTPKQGLDDRQTVE